MEVDMDNDNVEVVIMGKVYNLTGGENKEYLQKIATYMDRKLHEVSISPDFNRMSVDHKQLMINLNVADDYFKANDWAIKLQQDKEKSQKEIYNLKERIVSLEMELNSIIEELEVLKSSKKTTKKN